MTVFVVRGDVVRRYPTAHYFLQKARLDARQRRSGRSPGRWRRAAVRGALDRDTLFVGFEKTPARGDRRSRRRRRPRLAARDRGAAGGAALRPRRPAGPARLPPGSPPTGTTLSWANVAAGEKALARPDPRARRRRRGSRARRSRTPPGAANAAHMARACHQAAVPHLLPRPTSSTSHADARPASEAPRSTPPCRPYPSSRSPPARRSARSTAALPLALLPLRLEVRFWTASTPGGAARAHLPRRDARRRPPAGADGDRAGARPRVLASLLARGPGAAVHRRPRRRLRLARRAGRALARRLGRARDEARSTPSRRRRGRWPRTPRSCRRRASRPRRTPARPAGRRTRACCPAASRSCCWTTRPSSAPGGVRRSPTTSRSRPGSSRPATTSTAARCSTPRG